MFLLFILLNFLFILINAYIDTKSRVDCDPKPGTNKERCMSLGCWWDNDFDDVKI